LSLQDIGPKIAKLRETNGVSSADLAETIGISRGYLSRVENGRQVPSLVIVDAIARQFGVELDYFFSSASHGEVVVHPAVAETVKSLPSKATFTYEALCTERQHKLAQPFIAMFRPRTRTRVAVHSAEYFRYVVSGRIALHYNEERYELLAGDAIYYDASLAHEIECLGPGPAKVLTVYAKPSGFGAAMVTQASHRAAARPTVIEGHL
jgi:transcriptional regulator with XRE-family HTH domain